MTSPLIEAITATHSDIRNQPLRRICDGWSGERLLQECAILDQFWRNESNLYERVRALLFLHSLHRFHLLPNRELPERGLIPYSGIEHFRDRRFIQAVDEFQAAVSRQGPSRALSSALAAAYHQLGFQTLADQVRRSVQAAEGNAWMFEVNDPSAHPQSVVDELEDGEWLRERTPVRMDLSHSAWSDIFFLGMDYPEGARVLNVSIDLSVHGRNDQPQPPIQTRLRVISEPVIRLESKDLGAQVVLTRVAECFDFAADHLGLLKAGLIASGLIPPSLEKVGGPLEPLLRTVLGPGRGLEIVTQVHDIPKGSRLAVSTNLLASLISLCMRATGQTERLTGPLQESERRQVAARAILGEWLGGSGGGWQDSGGLWPSLKLIRGVAARAGDPEFGISRGCLLPTHHLLDEREAPESFRQQLEASLVLVHGGMAQNVGPVLEMVTEKYLLRSEPEWQARHETGMIFEEILAAFRNSDVQALGAATERNFFGPLQTIIPAVNNPFTESLVEDVRRRFGRGFWGFWMLGGMSGGGMGFMFDPNTRDTAREEMQSVMYKRKVELRDALPFAMDPVVYDFAINAHGSVASRRPQPAPAMLEPAAPIAAPKVEDPLHPLLEQLGFDVEWHEAVRQDLIRGQLGLAQNRLPAETRIEDVHDSDVTHESDLAADDRRLGERAVAEGRVGVMTLAAGVGSRWTQGAGVVKALHPFCRMQGQYRSFMEIHLAKTRKTQGAGGGAIPHILSTSHLTHAPIARALQEASNIARDCEVHLSPGKSVGLRMIPTLRDLRFAWEELPQQKLDEQAQKVQESQRNAYLKWAQNRGEASDYGSNAPNQCLHPLGHWFEIPYLLKNGVLQDLLSQHPRLQVLLLHNIDTLGANIDPALLGWFLNQQATLSFEVVSRTMEDQGGGLARINGRPRLVEGMAMPREEDEYRLSYYNSMTTWIHIDRLLGVFGLSRPDLAKPDRVQQGIRRVADRLPTYITLKDVKQRWGQGQEDVFPVSQFEKLWSDMTALEDVDCRYLAVSRNRGQQLKDPAQLDGWLRDGSHQAVEALCEFSQTTPMNGGL